jgi:effector-binding domain-containing protein
MMTYEITVEHRDAQHAAVVRGTMTAEELPAFFDKTLSEVLSVLGEQGLSVTGPPFGLYHLAEDGFDVSAGFPVSDAVRPQGSVEPTILPGGSVATTIHVGSYDDVADAYTALTEWFAVSDYVPTGAPWESYLDDPLDEPAPRTMVCFPCQAMDPTA